MALAKNEQQIRVDKACISPKSVVGKDMDEIAVMFGSHDWVVDNSRNFGTEGVLIHYHCSRCRAVSFATIQEEE